MLPIIAESIFLASTGLLAFGSLMLVILLLISEGGIKSAIGYSGGYVLGYLIIGFLVITINKSISGTGGERPNVFSFLQVVLGVLLMFISFRNYKKPYNESGENRFLRIVDKMTPRRAFGFGMAVTVINFKNLALFLAAISVVAFSNIPYSVQILLLPVIVGVFCLSVIAPILVYLIYQNEGKAILTRFRGYLETNSRSISIWGPLLFGTLLLLRGGLEIL